MQGLMAAANCRAVATPILRQHRAPRGRHGWPWQVILKSPLLVRCLLYCNPSSSEASSWAAVDVQASYAPACSDSASKTEERAHGILPHRSRQLSLIAAPSLDAGTVVPPAVQQQHQPPRWPRPWSFPHLCHGTAQLKLPEHWWPRQPQHSASACTAYRFERPPALDLDPPADIKRCSASPVWASEICAEPMDMDLDEEANTEHRRHRPVNPRFLTGVSGARRREPIYAEDVRSRGPPLTRFHPGLAVPLPDELFEGLTPGSTPRGLRRARASTAAATHDRTTSVVEIEDDSPREGDDADDDPPGVGDAAPKGPMEEPRSARPTEVEDREENKPEAVRVSRSGRWLTLQQANPRQPIDFDIEHSPDVNTANRATAETASQCHLPPQSVPLLSGSAGPTSCALRGSASAATLRGTPALAKKGGRPTHRRRRWKVHTLGKALLPCWRQTWRTGFQRAYRAVHSARGGFIGDVPSLLWLARSFHYYHDRSSWPGIHTALQRLTGTPGLEDLRAALMPLESRRRIGRKGPHCSERCDCGRPRCPSPTRLQLV